MAETKTTSVTITDWTSANGVVYPPGEHEVDEATAELLTASEERLAEQQKKAQAAAKAVVEVAPERQTMLGVHDYVQVQYRPDLDDPEATVHPDAEARAETSAEMRQAEFDLRAASMSPSATPAVPQADNTSDAAPARTSSTPSVTSTKAASGASAPAPAPSGSATTAPKPTST